MDRGGERGMDRIEGSRIVVAGGGVAGLTAARALALRGAQVAVAEARAFGFLHVGALQIAPNAVRVLDALGLGAAARSLAVRAQALRLIDGFTGRTVTRLDLSARDWLLMRRDTLISVLTAGAVQAGARVQPHAHVTFDSLDPAANSYALDLDAPPQLAIAADGIHSRARGLVDGAAPARFSGQVAWRALIPETEDRTPEVRVYLGPGCHLVTYPVGPGPGTGQRAEDARPLRNLVAVEERSAWQAEGWDSKDDPDSLRQAFASFAPEVGRLLARVDETRIWGLFLHPVARTWHAGGLVLAGDAAHPTLPFLAQGANLAIEDGWELAASLDAAGLAEGPALYQARRRERAARIVAAANANARNYHLRGVARYAAHKVLRVGGLLAPKAALGRYDWIYGHDVTRGATPAPEIRYQTAAPASAG